MSEADRACEYVLDPDDPETWGGEEGEECYVEEEVLNEEGVWTCPHDVEGDKEFCKFHDPDDNSNLKNRLLKELQKAARSDDPETAERTSQFIGAKFGSIKITDMSLPSGLKRVDFSHSTFRGHFGAIKVDVPCELVVRSSDFHGITYLSGSHLERKVDFSRSKFHDDVQFKQTVFEALGVFREVEYQGNVNFEFAKFRDRSHFRSNRFGEDVDFSSAEFSGQSDFVGSRFAGHANFVGVLFSDSVMFNRSEFSSTCSFERSEFKGSTGFLKTVFEADTEFSSCTFADNSVFREGTFEEEIEFVAAEFNGRTVFMNQSFHNPPNFRGAVLPGASFSNLNLQNSDFHNANLQNADFESVNLKRTNVERANLSGANFIGTDLSGCRIYSARMDGAVINTETTFDEHGDNRCIYDPQSGYDYDPSGDELGQYRKAMSGYRVLEKVARANSFPDKQSAFFARRQDMRRAQLREDESFPRLNYWFAEAQNAVFRHGESFSRVVGWSIGTIVAFALLFPVGGWLRSGSSEDITYGVIADSPLLLWKSFYHSTLLFLTGTGPLTPTGTVGEILTTIEVLIAPILLALLVFVLGRRAAR